MSVPVRHAVSGIVSGPASPVQAAALGDAIAGEDLLAVAPTGSGKTLVFARTRAYAEMLAERYDKDTVFAATGISVSLLLCLASIPLLMAIAGM